MAITLCPFILFQMSHSPKSRGIHSMTLMRYLLLLLLVLCSTLGDVFLSRGMKQIGRISPTRWHDLLFAVTNPWVMVGILLLLVFFSSYLSSLSWADLSYIMPATSFGNVFTALLAKFYLHENIPVARWLGILLITFGVGFVARGPSLTVRPAPEAALPEKSNP